MTNRIASAARPVWRLSLHATPALLRAAAGALAVPSALVTHVARAHGRGHARGVPAEVADLVLRSPEAVAQALTALATRRGGQPAGEHRSLGDALDELGFDALHHVLTHCPTYSVLHPPRGPGGLSALAFATRGGEVARLAADLVPHLPGGVPGDAGPAHAAGLLHGIGAVVLMDPPAGLYPEGLDPTRVDQVDLGALLCRLWGLTPAAVEAVREHQAPAPPAGAVGRAVWMAVRVEAARSGSSATSLAGAAGACGIDPGRLADALIGDIEGSARDPLDELTPREHEVLVRLAAGEVPKQIAVALGCSPSTVNNHLHHVYRKLGVSGQAHALLVARERGWV